MVRSRALFAGRGNRRRARTRRNGQSLVEFAVLLPVVLMLVLMGIDFGRVFLGWVSLNNSARIAANYAAQHPTAWNAGNPDAAAQTTYNDLVQADAAGINCALTSPLPTPTFPAGQGIGSPAEAAITCGFEILTPIISSVVGNPLNLTARAAFPIRAGAIEGIPVGSAAPPPSQSASPSASASESASASASSSASASASASATPSPTPMCVVPNLVGQNTKDAQDLWGTKGHAGVAGAGFTTNVIYNPQVNGPPSNYRIVSQSLAPGQSLPCGSATITVFGN